jgi:hypothetical protein
MPPYKTRREGGTDTIIQSQTHETMIPLAPVVYIDDFFGAGTVIPAAGSPESGTPYVAKIVGAGPPTVAIKADETNGAIECALTATSEKQDAALYMNDELQFSIAQGLVFETRFKPSVLPTGTGEINIGLASNWADDPNTITYNIFASLDGSGEVFCEKDDNATDESATSGVTLLNTDWCIVRIDCSTAADVKFYVNGARVAGGTTFDWAASAANSKVQPFVSCYKASGTGVGTVVVDYVKVWQNRT